MTPMVLISRVFHISELTFRRVYEHVPGIDPRGSDRPCLSYYQNSPLGE